jgi:hypothetical protein
VVTPGVAYHPLETLDDRARTLAALAEIFAEVGSDHALAIAAHAYPGAESELAVLLDDLRNGRPVKI